MEKNKQIEKGSELKKMKKFKSSYKKKKSYNLSQNIAELDHTETEEKRVIKLSGEKKGTKEKKRKLEATKSDIGSMKSNDKANGDDQKGKLSKKRKAQKASQSGHEKAKKLDILVEGDSIDQKISQENTKTKTSKMRKKRRKDEKRKNIAEEKTDKIHKEVEDAIREENVKLKDTHKMKKKKIKKSQVLSVKDEKVKPEEDDVYEMSSDDEDCTRGMKKWITEYHQSRPGIKVLQDQIDDFITAHEEQEKKAQAEKEAQAAEGGWTVVQHHKGRKKTTEAESGTVVGSVAQAAIMENMAKKKNNQVGLNFYRFQKREARMNEVMALQSKFEQDKKRIQQMRAARKFRPY